ncbi:MAG: DUF1830 domain-containing protein [Elainellaceae cyanobacterium]
MSTSFVTRQHANAVSITDQILCYYVNHSSELQVLRIQGPANFYFEKVVFAQERLLFDAPRTATLEVFTQAKAADLALQKTPCHRLQVREGSGSS